MPTVINNSFDPFKDLIWDDLLKATIKSFFAKYLGSFAGGILGWIFGNLIIMVAGELYTSLRESFNLDKIEFKNKEAHDTYVKSSVVLKIIYDQKGKDSDEFRKARDENRKKLQDFVHHIRIVS